MRLKFWLAIALGAVTGSAALPSVAEAAGNAAAGEAIAQQWCSSCHLVAPNQAAANADVPTLAAVAARSPDAIAALAGFLADPHPPMPNFSLTRDEIRDILAYIDSLRPAR